jgi:hypothetical protein
MSNLDKLQSAFMKADALAQQGDEKAKADATLFAQEIRRLQSEIQPEVDESFVGEEGFMAQLNRGIAESAGGLVDFINPFDKYTGSAATGLKSAMEALGINIAEQDPEGFLQNFAYGAGSAAGAVIPATKSVQALQQAPGLIGQIAKTLAPQMATKGAVGAELIAGGSAGGGASEAERRGYSEPVQQVVGLLAGLTPAGVVPAAKMVGRGISNVVQATPIIGTGVKMGAAAVAPFTKTGARRLVTERLRELSGGAERAAEAGRRIDPNDNILGLSPAEQTGEAKLIELQRAAMRKDPKVAEAISKRQFEADTAAREGLEMGGRVEDAQAFVAQRQADFADTLDNYIAAARASAQKKIPKSGMDSIQASEVVAKELRRAENIAKANQKMLWSKIPEDFKVDVSGTRSTIQSLAASATRIGKGNLPPEASDFLKATQGTGTDRVDEINSLYTAMRDTARNAMSGDKVNRDQARISNSIADAILDDLDSIRPDTDVNKMIVEARTFSRQMHDKFSRGTAGKLLKRTGRGEDAIPQGLTLQRTIGSGGDAGSIAQREIAAATDSVPEIGEASNATANYLRNIFNDKAFSGDKFSLTAAENFLGANQRLLDRFPNVLAEIQQSIASQSKLQAATSRTSGLSSAVKQSTSAKFAQANPEKALDAVINAQDPRKAMSNLIASAKKDKTGAALNGIKRAVIDVLINRSLKIRDIVSDAGATSELRGTNLSEALSDNVLGGIAKQALSKAEMYNVRIISKELEKLDKARVLSSVGEGMSLFKPNSIISIASRILAARYGSTLGGGMGGSLQSAQLASGRAQRLLEGLTNSKAQQLMIDTVQDPELMRTMLLDISNPKNLARLEKSLAPYIVGSVVGINDETSGDRDQPIMVPREPLRIEVTPMPSQ